MYRQYEDPHKLEKQLAKLKRRYKQSQDEDEKMYLSEEIAELKDRINFAWQDDEFDSEFYADLLMEQKEQM